jgi:hypothetical protein
MELSKNRKRLNYIITYLVIAFSGIPFFDANKLGRFALLLGLGALFIYYKKKVGKDIVIIVVATLMIVLVQAVFWGGKLFTSITLVGLLVLIPYFAIKIIGPQFPKYYRTVFYYMSIISITFWVLTNTVPGFQMLTYQISLLLFPFTPWPIPESMIIYTLELQEVYGFVRNPGALHEPGAHSVFLVLAIVSEIFVEKKLITKRNLVFFANLITTFSTAGFLAMFVLVTFYIYSSKRLTAVTKYFLVISIAGLLTYLFFTLEFLGQKLEEQVQDQTEQALHEETSGRFLGARKALIVLYRYPLFGRGLLSATQAEADSDEAAGYGWITWVSRIGLVAGLFYMFMIYKGVRNYSIVNLNSKLFSYFAFLAMLGVLAGQKHTSAIIYFMMFLIPVLFPLNKYAEEYYLKK